LNCTAEQKLIIDLHVSISFQSLHDIIQTFWQTIDDLDQWCLAKDTHALILLDSIDQLFTWDGNVFGWFEGRSYEHVRIVVTTLSWVASPFIDIYPWRNQFQTVQDKLMVSIQFVPCGYANC
jgi:hypothetical protein